MLPDGTVVSGDSLGNVQFWDAQHGTLLQGFARHRGPVLALAALPDGRTVFASGVDNQVGFQHCCIGQWQIWPWHPFMTRRLILHVAWSI